MNKVPQHIALIPDGNRRWAREKGLSTLKGHWRGYKNIIEFSEWCKNRGVRILTVFCFSTENWKRTEKEVNYLMKLLKGDLLNKKNIAKFQREGVRLKIIGQKERLPEFIQKTIVNIENLTKDNKNLQLNLAISYGGRWDILQTVQKLVRKKISAEKITEDLITQNLSTVDLLDPDLIIRTGGEKRLSNFILWQAAYSELYFYKKYWPAFTENDLDQILRKYARCKKRLGK